MRTDEDAGEKITFTIDSKGYLRARKFRFNESQWVDTICTSDLNIIQRMKICLKLNFVKRISVAFKFDSIYEVFLLYRVKLQIHYYVHTLY